jgi:hypothetical protein
LQRNAVSDIAQQHGHVLAANFCAVPIMREHHLSVMSLEEYEPNREFVGRNFNAGEVIQLVLKARSGHWLPFNYVQMVMMHEYVSVDVSDQVHVVDTLAGWLIANR